MFQTNTPYFDCYFGYYSKSPRLYFQPSQVTGSHKVMVNLFQHLPFVPFVIAVPVVILECVNRAVALEGCSPGPRRFPFPPSFTKRRHSELDSESTACVVPLLGRRPGRL